MYETMQPGKRNLIIEKILRAEWEMLKNVDNIGGKADCQEDWTTFHIMRYSYYNAWPDTMIRSYVRDLEEAMEQDRNLVMEKYAYMMEFTDPAYFNSKLSPFLPKIDDNTKKLIDEIAEYLTGFDKEFTLQYPKLSTKGRPVEAAKDGTETSAETYARGELRTYSQYTLKLFLDYLKKCRAEGTNFAFLVKDKMVKMYGYDSIEAAEAKM
ncbi:DUF4125 family protein [Sinanaerobacter chloroacetimidivorans]|jgi:hypothetical protein|uniref:DUF4125 family protein n=1 Tax=Sinanaerobacter chloroacetimidivorans TaxID=2818044 RepID=A0A8J8B0N3_9FIRM|nr:DUF4125 family protein [Sinanaerobacter chloroacetimidivorans]MBR0597354.1 DUF4125 family protein [Sinanaerobacter chloroacetimidivorans]